MLAQVWALKGKKQNKTKVSPTICVEEKQTHSKLSAFSSPCAYVFKAVCLCVCVTEKEGRSIQRSGGSRLNTKMS